MFNGVILNGVIDRAVDIGVNVGVQHFEKQIEQRVEINQLHNSMNDYMKRQKALFEKCTLDEEYDYEGLLAFIDSNCLEDISNCVFQAKARDRKKAREELFRKGISYAKANKAESKRIVVKILSTLIDLVRKFYIDKVDKKLWLVAATITDTVVDRIEDGKEEVLAELKRIQEPINITACIDLANNDPEKFKKTVVNLKTAMNELHPLKPDYGYDLNMRSVPLTPEAEDRYPQRIQLSGVFKNQNNTVPGMDPFEYADRHQLSLEILVLDAKKFLGEIEDPYQDEAKAMIGRTIIRTPKEFPPAIPCCIMVNNEMLIKYVKLRTEEILDDGTYVISNKEQEKAEIDIRIQINPNRKDDRLIKLNFNTRPNISNREFLNFHLYMKAVSNRCKIEILDLEEQKTFIAGHMNPGIYKSSFATLDDDIDFLSRICTIEDYSKQQVQLPEMIRQSDFAQVVYVTDLIKKKRYYHNWEAQEFYGPLSDEVRSFLIEYGKDRFTLNAASICEFELYGVHIEIPILRVYENVVIKDVDRIIKRLELTEDGEQFSLTLAASEETVVYDQFREETSIE